MSDVEILAVRDKNGNIWYIICPNCGRKLIKLFTNEDKSCECGWLWKGIDRKEEVKIAIIRYK